MPSCVGRVGWSGKEDEKLLGISPVDWLKLRVDSLHGAAVGYNLLFAIGGREGQENG